MAPPLFRSGESLLRLPFDLCPDAFPGQAGSDGYPAAVRQAKEEREEGAAAGRAPSPEGLHWRDRLAGGNSGDGLGDLSPKAPPPPGSPAPLGRAVSLLPGLCPTRLRGKENPSPPLCPPLFLPHPLGPVAAAFPSVRRTRFGM